MNQPKSYSLRTYQRRAIEYIRSALRDDLKALAVLATGAGKTVILSEMVADLLRTKPSFRVLFIVHKTILATQIEQSLERSGVQCGVYCGSFKRYELEQVTVGLYQSLAGNPNLGKYDFIVVDECFTPDTEVLTERGFVRFDSLSKELLVAQFDQNNHEISFCKPIRHIKKYIDGNILKFKDQKNTEIYCTENHELLISRKGINQKIEAKEFNPGGYNKILKAGKASGKSFKLSPEERLLIAYQADGSLHKKGVMAFQFSKERKINDFFDLMNEGKFCFNETKSRKAEGKIKERRRFFVKQIKEFSKDLWSHFNLSELSQDKCKEIIEYMVKWDGSIISDTLYYYSTTEESNADFYQSICVLAGYSSRKTIQKDERKETYKDVYRLFIRKNRNSSGTQRLKKQTVKYRGDVYCVSVPKQNIIIRKNGKVSVVGNCHRLSDSYKDIMARVSHDRTRVLGVTATPYAAKGYIYGDKAYWPAPCFTKGIAELTQEGWLVRAVTTAPVDRSKWIDTKGLKITGGDFNYEQVSKRAVKQELVEIQVADALPKLRGRHHVAWMCCTIEHARMVEMELAGLGQSCSIYTSKEDSDEKDEALRLFRSGRTRHIVFVTILSEGFDEPSIDALVILRPTRSPTLYLQCIGRTLRPHADKKDALILDYGGVIEALGPIDNPVVLEPREGNPLKKLIDRGTHEQWMQCHECGAFFNQSVEEPVKCPECGAGARASDIKERLRKLKKVSSKHSLYSKAGQIEWALVEGYSFYRDDGFVDFVFETNLGKKKLRMMTPQPMRTPTNIQMGQMRRAKRYLELFFGCQGASLAAKLIHLGESATRPKWVACHAGSDDVVELNEAIDPNAAEQVASRAEQERLI